MRLQELILVLGVLVVDRVLVGDHSVEIVGLEGVEVDSAVGLVEVVVLVVAAVLEVVVVLAMVEGLGVELVAV